MKNLILVRHGEAEHMVGDLIGGSSDTALTGRGLRQAQLTAGRLARDFGADGFQLYASDLRRAQQTALAIQEQSGQAIIFDPRLRELDNGAAAGLTRAEAKKLYRPPTQPMLDWVPYPDAESWRAFLARLTPCLEMLAQQEGTLVVVSHSLVLRAAVGWWLRLTEPQIENTYFTFSPCSLTWLMWSNWGSPGLHTLNDTAHLNGAGTER